ncbi:MAG: LAGLIDADG family homing endonuclease [archaeon]|nr:LAGLIDADG family homing endonuclease [archaeon]
MGWSLYSESEKCLLKPLEFSNGKTQEDIVNEVLDSVKKGCKIIFIRGVCGTGKCLDKDSLIFCKLNSEDNFSYYKISDLEGKEGEIISLDEFGKIVQTKFKNVRKTGKKPIYHLKTKTGREILTSQNHPFLTISENGVEWKKLEELTDKSYICIPNKIDLNKQSYLEEEKIRILAHLISEGKLGDKAGSPKYYQDRDINPKIRKDYEEALRKLFPDGEIKNNHKTEVTINFNNMNTRFGTTNKLRLFIREFGLDGKKSKEKFVPKIIFNLNEKQISLFLRTLFSGDGCIYSKKSVGKNEGFIIEYSSISKRLIQDVSLLLNRIGIQHSITSKKFRENLNYCYRITISSQNQIKKFIELVGFIGEKQETALKILPKLKEHKFTNIDKVPRIIREYLKNKGYNYTELDRFLNYEEIENLRKEIGFKKIRKNPLIKTPFVFNQGKIDFLRSHINKINKYVKDKTLSFICSKDIVWDKVKCIKYLKEEEVYDLEVPEYNNFIADGIIVHNSAIALNIAKNLGKTSIVVPGKTLQGQYKEDYELNKYLLKENGEKLKISIIMGRNNFKCKFLKEEDAPIFKEEKNLKLNELFKKGENKNKDFSADNFYLPCKIEIKEKNIRKIEEYLKKNKNFNQYHYKTIKDIKRASIAPVCPYWSPVFPEKFELNGKNFENVKKRSYMGLNKTKFVFYQRSNGCEFYDQFNSFIDSDVIVFNSLKYKLESSMNRKPETEVEIIDECDEFLDSFSNQRVINIDRLQNSINQIISDYENSDLITREITKEINNIKNNERIKHAVFSKEIIPLKDTEIYELFKILLENQEFIYDVDEESYLFDVAETARIFDESLDDTYITFHKQDNNLIAELVTINLAKRFKEMLDKNKRIIMMSGTIHSENVLKNIFGLENYQIIDAETEQQGKIEIVRTGLEMDCKYENFANGTCSREKYLKSLSKCVEIAKKPLLVHINSFYDLPSEDEIRRMEIKNIISMEKLKEIQKEDKQGNIINEFKDGKIEILFSTKCTRGVDFPGKQCNSIIFTKYPNPDVKSAFWKILKQTKPDYYWDFYKDKAKRELLQRIYRGLRFKEDHIYLLSPDERVLKAFE